MKPIQNTKEKDLERAEILLEQAKPNVELEVFDEPTVRALEEAMVLFEKWNVEEKRAEVYECWGKYQSEREDFKEAHIFYQKSLKIRLSLFGEQHESIATTHLLIGHCYSSTQDFKNAQISFDKALEITQSLFNEAHSLTAQCYEGISSLLFEQNQFQSSFEYATKALDIVQNLSATPPLFLGKLYNLLSSLYNAKEDYENVKYYIEKAMRLYEDVLPATHKHLGANYYNLSYFYYGLMNLELALLYMKKALQLFEHQNPKGIYTIWAYHSLQQIYGSQVKRENSISYGKKALSLLREKGNIKSNLGILILKELSIAFGRKKQFSKCFNYLEQSLQFSIEIFGSESMPVASIQHIFGRCYLMASQHSKAETYFRKSLSTLEKLPRVHSNHYLNIWSGLGKSIGHSPTPDYQLGLYFIHKALIAPLEKYDNEDVYQYPSLQDLIAYQSFIDSIANTTIKAVTFFRYYQYETKSIKDLKAAFRGFDLAIQLANHARQSFQSDASKLWIAEKMQTTINESFDTVMCLYEKTKVLDYLQFCFQVSEQDKAYLLLSNNQEKNAQRIAQIPQALLQTESELKTKLTLLQKSIQAQEQKEKKANTILLQQYQNDYFDAYTQFEALKQQLETDYPDYYRQKYSIETVSISSLQSFLQPHQTVLSYFIGEEKNYLFAITSDEYEVFAMEKPDNFIDLIQNYLQSIKFHQKQQFQQLSFELYQVLIQEAVDYLIDPFGEENRQVFIIPHAELHYLPFETLIISESSSSESYKELDYLLNHCQISYHYSATLLHLDLQKQAIQAERAPNDIAFTGFAPVYETTSNEQKQALEEMKEGYAAVTRSEAVRSDGTWMPLPYSRLEVENIVQLFEKQGLEGQAFLHESATKRNLEEQIGKSRFVLIAAHGIVNDEFPELSGLVLSSNDRRRTVDAGWEQESGDSEESINGVENLPSFDSPFGGGKGEVNGDIRNGQKNSEQTIAEDCLLNMKEVAMIPMSADLVVLSSCESGIGELHKGEGMMAVNRGFLASGAKNVVSTLFKVNDRASSELTTLLFRYILEGNSYSTALQQAKLDLSKGKGMSPKMWSGFVMFGAGI